MGLRTPSRTARRLSKRLEMPSEPAYHLTRWASASFRRTTLISALAAYVILVAIFAMRQAGYVNADFIGYVTIAHRTLDRSHSSITAYWSPLYSWCMVPLIGAGLDDLVAGRLILALSGAIYLLAIFGIVSRFQTGRPWCDVPLVMGVMACSVVQATAWANYVLTPDLLADALLFLYLLSLLDPVLPKRPWIALLGGLAAGLAYLAKAYMLPFVLVQLPIALGLRHVLSGVENTPTAARLRSGLKVWGLYLAGIFFFAGPWIGVLTAEYGRLTFSTAGSSNHANVSPENDDHDPLWNPGLVPDYISDPKLLPDWSPFQDSAHLLHQIKLIARNGTNCVGAVFLWFILTAIGVVYLAIRQRRQKRRLLVGDARFGAWWSLLTVAVYCGGYSLVNLEARYIAPVAAPLLCLAAMLFFGSAASRSRDSKRIAGKLPVFSLAVRSSLFFSLFLLQDLNRFVRIAFTHPQCSAVSFFQPIAERLEGAGLSKQPMAANRWHSALTVAYLCENLPGYLGSPLAKSPDAIRRELAQSGATVYLRWARASQSPLPMRDLDAFIPTAPWKFALRINAADLGPTASDDVTVYAMTRSKGQPEPSRSASGRRSTEPSRLSLSPGTEDRAYRR